MPRRSGTPCSASQASSAYPSRPPSCFGETRTLYAGRPATLVAVAADTSASAPSFVRKLLISSTEGAWPLSADGDWDDDGSVSL